MDIGTLLLVGIIVAGLAIGGFVALIVLAILTYLVKNLYPVTRRVGLWASKRTNFVPLLILDVILVVLIVVVFVVAFRLPTIVELLLILLGLILVVVLAVVALLVVLAILVYIIRIARWFYGRWRGLLGGALLQTTKLKIRHDVVKDKDVTGSFAELRAKLAKEADQARHKISKTGK